MEKIVVGYDHSDAAQAALRWAELQALRTGAQVVLVYVASSIGEWELAAAQIDPDPVRRELQRRLDEEWSESLRKAEVPYRTKLAVGRVADGLMKVARDEHASLLVIGMTPRGTLGELVFGSTQHQLLHHAVRPVVAVPASWSEPSEERAELAR